MRASLSNMKKLATLRKFSKLTHIDTKTSSPVMVDITDKIPTLRYAHARAIIILPTIFSKLINTSSKENEINTLKGPVFSTAIVAGVMAAKKTSELIPFCHSVLLDDCKININFNSTSSTTTSGSNTEVPIEIIIDCRVKTIHKTGVEMEALVGATNAALCCYDMLKAVSHEIEIKNIKLIEKTGGKSTYKVI